MKIKHLKYATVDKFVEHLTSEANGMADLPLVRAGLGFGHAPPVPPF